MIYGAGESCQKKVDTKKIGKDGKEETVATWEATPRKTILEFACDVTQVGAPPFMRGAPPGCGAMQRALQEAARAT